jgi:hypothetical protein
MDTGGSFPGDKEAGREADHSPPANAEVKKIWIYTSMLGGSHVTTAWCVLRLRMEETAFKYGE